MILALLKKGPDKNNTCLAAFHLVVFHCVLSNDNTGRFYMAGLLTESTKQGKWSAIQIL
jgi:hypothetical protein